MPRTCAARCICVCRTFSTYCTSQDDAEGSLRAAASKYGDRPCARKKVRSHRMRHRNRGRDHRNLAFASLRVHLTRVLPRCRVALRDLAMRHLAQRASTCALDSATARRCIATSDELTRLDLVSLHDLDHAVLLDCKRDRRRNADAVGRISRARIVVLVPRRSLDVYRSGVESRARIARMRLPLRITALQRASNARFVLQCGQRIHPAALSITETARGRHAHSARGLNSSAAERVLRKINRATERCALVHGFFPLKRGI